MLGGKIIKWGEFNETEVGLGENVKNFIPTKTKMTIDNTIDRFIIRSMNVFI